MSCASSAMPPDTTPAASWYRAIVNATSWATVGARAATRCDEGRAGCRAPARPRLVHVRCEAALGPSGPGTRAPGARRSCLALPVLVDRRRRANSRTDSSRRYRVALEVEVGVTSDFSASDHTAPGLVCVDRHRRRRPRWRSRPRSWRRTRRAGAGRSARSGSAAGRSSRGGPRGSAAARARPGRGCAAPGTDRSARRGAPGARSPRAGRPPARAPAAGRRASGRSRRSRASAGSATAARRLGTTRSRNRSTAGARSTVGTVDLEGLEPDEVLPCRAERNAAGRQHAACRTATPAAPRGAGRSRRRALSQLSKISERLACSPRWSSTSSQRSSPRPGTPRRRRHRRGDERRLVDRREVDHPRAVGPLVGDPQTDLRGQAGLAHPAGPGERDEAPRADPLPTSSSSLATAVQRRGGGHRGCGRRPAPPARPGTPSAGRRPPAGRAGPAPRSRAP